MTDDDFSKKLKQCFKDVENLHNSLKEIHEEYNSRSQIHHSFNSFYVDSILILIPVIKHKLKSIKNYGGSTKNLYKKQKITKKDISNYFIFINFVIRYMRAQLWDMEWFFKNKTKNYAAAHCANYTIQHLQEIPTCLLHLQEAIDNKPQKDKICKCKVCSETGTSKNWVLDTSGTVV